MSDSNPGFYRRGSGEFVIAAIFDGMVEVPLEAATNISL